MEMRQLRYFVAVARERNFSRAAERLNMAQPPLSRQIRMLEEEMGTDLVDRSVRPLRLTAPGRLFLKQAEQILDHAEATRQMIERASASGKQSVVFGFVASTMYGRFPALIRGFRQVARDVELQLVEMSSLEQMAALKEGRIDAGFGTQRFEDPAVRRVLLREEKMVVAMPVTHPLAADNAPLPLWRIAQEPQILYPARPRPSYADQVLAVFHDHGLTPRIGHEARELHIAIGLVAAAEGIAVVPDSLIRSGLEGVCYRPIEEGPTSPIFMCFRCGDTSRPLRQMKEVICEMYPGWNYPVPEGLRADLQG
ncbi:LysR family transcriptional regulator [Pseudooceanicola sp. CBS1P-1]|uniref:LysR family transcriptional regulator n=1 Tax=Pseudooceanicola albus TaxID=2692189 RepID=A0A6L7G5L9_9RHOB|nr:MULTISPECIES: LysR family transcriptional regulator [Pseudooceanicola]MBT9385324.1 LysR family transcriptional regulator [Pseudooceanicola endophyticus]MXN18817.1 LysR family transcriptional regulator [Pseudooceanicola albus]